MGWGGQHGLFLLPLSTGFSSLNDLSLGPLSTSCSNLPSVFGRQAQSSIGLALQLQGWVISELC